MATDENYPRTRDESLGDLNYAARLHELHARLYQRVRWILAFIVLLAGASAITEFVQGFNHGVFVIAAVVAVVTVIDALGRWDEEAAAHRQFRKELMRVLSRSACMSMEELDCEYYKIEAEAHDAIRSLELVAFNDTAGTRFPQLRKGEGLGGWVVRLIV